MAHRKQNAGNSVSAAFIQKICSLYGDRYDDRIEDSRPPAAGKKEGKADQRVAGENWMPGMPAGHKSLGAFQKELAEKHGIRLSTCKIRKVLISGGVWSTERSREIQALFAELTGADSGVDSERVVGMISGKLGISKAAVVMNLPYINGVNRLEPKSRNAVRCERYREKKKETGGK